MVRLRETQAKRTLEEEFLRADWGGASAFTVESGARPGSKILDWWHENTPEKEASDTKRNLAYLRAYVRIAGERLYAGGLFLARKRLWMDRSVMSRLERDGYVSFNGVENSEPWFELTEMGERWIESGLSEPQ